jgi:methionine synthase II (cobalamin-independent)
MAVYRAEVIGSMLRPNSLKEASLKWQKGELSSYPTKHLRKSKMPQSMRP